LERDPFDDGIDVSGDVAGAARTVGPSGGVCEPVCATAAVLAMTKHAATALKVAVRMLMEDSW
jgi:hypothetical protein